MQASILQKGYVHPRSNLSTKSITLKEDWQTYPLSQGEKKSLDNNIVDFCFKDSFVAPSPNSPKNRMWDQ